ncbi:MAG TPA: hypothetical protein VGJ60_07030 [Chloroflexota bacterium]|jgi:hypothetical protein
MPKYVFEQSAILPADESLSVLEAEALSSVLAAELRRWLDRMHHRRHAVSYEPPFEQVGGDFLPPDEQGVVKLGEPVPIDL